MASDSGKAVQEFINANNTFTATVYKVLKGETGNLCVSPLSVETLLAFARSGCRDATAEEIRIALHLPVDKAEIEVGIKKVLSRLKETKNYALHSANKMYVKKDFEIREEFKTAATEIYQADLEDIDFIKNIEAARIMNKWVEEQTNNKIQNLINADDLDRYTRVILLNALYFKADWVSKFSFPSTKKRDFYKSATDVVQVDTMYCSPNSKRKFNYSVCDKLNAQFLELLFVGEDASMVIALPEEKEGLAALEEQIESVLGPRHFWKTLLTVALPKFKVESKICFKKVLLNLGVRKAFNEKEADLSGIAGCKGDLVIDDVVQKTFVDVNEVGVEAAAATMGRLIVPRSGIKGPIPSFIADHPFIFYIKIKGIIAFEIFKSESNNFFVSPLSVETVLAFAQSGSKNATAQEIRAALHLPDDKGTVEVGIKNFLPQLKDGKHHALHSANKMYIKDLEIKEGFKTAATEVYQADLENINFKKKAEAARIMNKWVKEQTNNKIQNLISSSDLTEWSRVILINALYFKAETMKRDFYKSAADVVQVDIMFFPSILKRKFSYFDCGKLNAQFLELPFQGEDASMVVILPNEKEGLAVLENQIESVFTPREFCWRTVNISLPKFKIESRIHFKRILLNVNLNGIAGSKGDLIIDNIVQKTFIDVSEDGVEAAAATDGLIAIPISLGRGPIPDFIADHPFIFYIKIKGIIAFAGRHLYNLDAKIQLLKKSEVPQLFKVIRQNRIWNKKPLYTSKNIVQVDTKYMISVEKRNFSYSECHKINAKFLELPFLGGDAF
ncbi:Serpin domain containing protein, partial [Asbolus verrucosus]